MEARTGTQDIGTGQRTTMGILAADRLGVPNAMIHLKQGDTDLIPMGGGHGSSRATYMGGTAIWRASDIIIAKGRALAAQALEAADGLHLSWDSIEGIFAPDILADMFAGYEIVAETKNFLITCADDPDARDRAKWISYTCEADLARLQFLFTTNFQVGDTHEFGVWDRLRQTA